MSKESYARGFCKVAEASGVNPEALAKYAGWFGIGGKKTEAFDPSQREDLVAVSNDNGIFYVPRAWDERESPTAWLKDTRRMGASSGLGMFNPNRRRLTISDFGSPASTTNSPYATWREFWSKPEAYTPKGTNEERYWKSVVLPDKSKAYVPASDKALQILKTMAGPSAQPGK